MWGRLIFCWDKSMWGKRIFWGGKRLRGNMQYYWKEYNICEGKPIWGWIQYLWGNIYQCGGKCVFTLKTKLFSSFFLWHEWGDSVWYDFTSFFKEENNRAIRRYNYKNIAYCFIISIGKPNRVHKHKYQLLLIALERVRDKIR